MYDADAAAGFMEAFSVTDHCIPLFEFLLDPEDAFQAIRQKEPDIATGESFDAWWEGVINLRNRFHRKLVRGTLLEPRFRLISGLGSSITPHADVGTGYGLNFSNKGKVRAIDHEIAKYFEVCEDDPRYFMRPCSAPPIEARYIWETVPNHIYIIKGGNAVQGPASVHAGPANPENRTLTQIFSTE